jgi:hypothetical protein
VVQWIRQLLGNVTGGELGLVGILFGAIVLFSWSPRIGEALGGLVDSDDEDS